VRVLVTGATGFVGRALAARLGAIGHEVVAWVRSPRRAREVLGPGVALADARGGTKALEAAVAAADAVCHLAGEPIVGERWTAARKRALALSRTTSTEALAEALRAAPPRPRVLVSASAVGFYGDTGDAAVDETSPAGAGFLAELCAAWEKAAAAAGGEATRVTVARLGVVLGPGGGALQKMRGPFRMGLGGPVGSGKQWLSWVHLDDLVSMWVEALADERFVGAWNAVSPTPVTSRDFARALGRALHRPAVMPVPAFALRALYGEGASVLLEGQRVLPARLEGLGFAWRYPGVGEALLASL
jgi:uncharacterized protein (TIGR01777 family)